MPVSRTRRSRRTRGPQRAHVRTRPTVASAGPHVASAPSPARTVGSDLPEELRELLPWLTASAAADAAEARGDALSALAEIHAAYLGPDGVPFWRPWRLRRLRQVVALGAALPGWAACRWVLAQAAQDIGLEAHDRLRAAESTALHVTRSQPSMVRGDVAHRMQLMDHDWVYRQLLLYDLGGVADFVERVAAPALLERAPEIRAWASAPMGGYRCLGPGSGPATSLLVDLATGELVEVPDRGGLLDVEPGETVIGRLVPTGGDGGSMFESAPLPVPACLALDVAARPDAWLEVLSSQAADDAFRRGELRTGGYEFDLLHDVHPLVWGWVVLGERLGSDDPLARPVLETARRALATGEDEVDAWPCLAAALVEPGVEADLARLPLGEEDREVLGELARRLTEPARSLAARLAG